MKSIDAAQDEIIEEMSGLGGGLEKYEYLVEVGRGMETPPEDEIRSDDYAVPGCQARVWIRAEMEDGRLRLQADSDAAITKGIIALLVRVMDGHPPEEIIEAELYFLDRTGLEAHLSPSRANGLASMVEKIRAYAEERRDGG